MKKTNEENSHLIRTLLAAGLIFSAGPNLTRAADPPEIAPPKTTNTEAKHLAGVRQVTHGLPRAGEGYFSPDGKSIVYQAYPIGYPFYQIYVQSLDGGQPRLVSTGRGRTTCSFFSPDGKQILFASS